MLYIKSSESIKVFSVIHDDAGWYYASISSVCGALQVHVQGYLYSKRLLPCRPVAMEEPHIVFEADRCSLATGRSPFSLSSSNRSQAAGFLPPHHKNKEVAPSFGKGGHKTNSYHSTLRHGEFWLHLSSKQFAQGLQPPASQQSACL